MHFIVYSIDYIIVICAILYFFFFYIYITRSNSIFQFLSTYIYIHFKNQNIIYYIKHVQEKYGTLKYTYI